VISSASSPATDGFARTMFESAVAIHYLESHPDLVQDYVDFLWVKRKRQHDDLVKYAPSQAKRVDPQQLAQMNTEYERVKPRFTDRKGRVRNSWSQLSFRAMSEDIKADSMYGGMYGFTSSITHTDMLGLVSASGDRDAVISFPSLMNIPLALQMGVVSYAMTLSAANQIAGLRCDESLGKACERFTSPTARTTRLRSASRMLPRAASMMASMKKQWTHETAVRSQLALSWSVETNHASCPSNPASPHRVNVN